MIRVVTEYHPNPRRPDGRLWCGCPEADVVVDENGVVVCAKCSGLPGNVVDEETPKG